MEKLLGTILGKLELVQRGGQSQIMVGFDGYVDSLAHPVKRIGEDRKAEYYTSMKEFGEFLTGRAERSCSIELHSITKKMGGNAPIFGRAAAALGIPTKCIGAFGYPSLHEVFREEIPDLEFISVANPGCCTALEFEDGKVMLAENEGINKLDYQVLQSHLKKGQLQEILDTSDVIALMNWSEMSGCGKIWEGLLEELLPNIDKTKERLFFLDLSDCGGRRFEDFEELTRLLGRFSDFGKVLLSLNRNEFDHYARMLGGEGSIQRRIRLIAEECALWSVVVHEHSGAWMLREDGAYFLENRYNHKPRILTGGGDNFNAGLACALTVGMDLREAVAVGNAVSGYYVTNAQSPSRAQLAEFIEEWMQELRREPAAGRQIWTVAQGVG